MILWLKLLMALILRGLPHLGIWLDDKLIFGMHIDSLLKKLRPFLFSLIKNVFLLLLLILTATNSTMYLLISIGLWWCICAFKYFEKLYVVYHVALWFVTGASVHTHHCNLYDMTQWTSLCLWRKNHMLIFILKALLGKLPQYISSLLTYCTRVYNTSSTEIVFN